MALTSDQIDIGDTRVADFVITVLEDAKASDVRLLDVRQLTDITDYMVIANGTSRRHVVAMAERVRDAGLKLELRPLAVEGAGEGDWIVLDDRLSEETPHLARVEAWHAQVDDAGARGCACVEQRLRWAG